MDQPNPSGPRLPNEILHAVLAQLPTDELLRLSTVNRAFYASVVIIVCKRVIQASAPPTSIELLCSREQPAEGFSTLRCRFNGVVPLGTRDDFGRAPPSLAELRQVYSAYSIAHRGRSVQGGDVPEIPFRLENGDVAVDTAGETLVLEAGSSLADPSVKYSIGQGELELGQSWLAQNAGEDHVGTILWFGSSHDMGIRVNVKQMEPTSLDHESSAMDASAVKYTIVFKVPRSLHLSLVEEKDP